MAAAGKRCILKPLIIKILMTAACKDAGRAILQTSMHAESYIRLHGLQSCRSDVLLDSCPGAPDLQDGPLGSSHCSVEALMQICIAKGGCNAPLPFNELL